MAFQGGQNLDIDRGAVNAQQSGMMKPPRFLLRGFRRPSDVALAALGHLERQILEEIWRRGETSVRDVFVSFEKRIAYTTLMTTLDRLFKKGLLSRRKDGRAFLYSAMVTSEEFEQRIAEDVIDGLLGRDSEGVEPILACIVDTITDNDRELLNELDRLIKQKRRELGGKG
jgi:predicted transcriptional regulator